MNYNYQPQVYANRIILENQKKREIRKTLSGLGFMVFAENLLFIFMFVTFSLITGFSPILESEFYVNNYYAIVNLFQGIVLFTSMVGIGLLYCAFSSTKISSVISFTPVKPAKFIAYVLFGLGIGYLANYITSVFLNNIQLIGITNTASTDLGKTDTLGYIVSTFITAVTPAFAEEFVFRGIIFGKLRKYGDGYAILVSALIFSLMHTNLLQIPFAFIGGVMFAYLTAKTNSLFPSMTVHFLNNLLSCIQGIIVDEGGTYISNFLPNVIFFAVLILGLLAFIYLCKKDKAFLSLTSDNNYSELSLKTKFGLLFSNAGSLLTIILLVICTLQVTKFG